MQSLCPQVAELGGQVEIVVSDNCSSDRTPHVVAAASEQWPVTYFRNETNIGSSNMLLAAARGSGEYSWIIGDDDMVVPGALPHVVRALRENPDVDFVYVNFFQAPIATRDEAIRSGRAAVAPPLERCTCQERGDRHLAATEEVLDLECGCPSELLTSIVSSIMRTRYWREAPRLLEPTGRPRVSAADRKLDDLFPHIKVIANTVFARPAFYVSRPCVLMGQGSQEWLSDWPIISLVGIGEALRLYEALGVEEQRVARLWRSYFQQSLRFMPLIGSRRHAPCLRGFPWGRFFAQNASHILLLLAVITTHIDHRSRSWVARSLPKPLYLCLRYWYRRARGLSDPAAGGQAR